MSISCLKNELFLKKNVEFIFSSFFHFFVVETDSGAPPPQSHDGSSALPPVGSPRSLLSLSLFLVWKSNSLQLSTSQLHYDPIDFSFIIIIIFLGIGFPTSPPPQEHNGSSTLPPVGSPIGQHPPPWGLFRNQILCSLKLVS